MHRRPPFSGALARLRTPYGLTLLVEKALDKTAICPIVSTSHPDYPEVFTAVPTKSTGCAGCAAAGRGGSQLPVLAQARTAPLETGPHVPTVRGA